MALKKTISRIWSCEKERSEVTAKEDNVERIAQKDVIVWSTRRHKGETISYENYGIFTLLVKTEKTQFIDIT